MSELADQLRGSIERARGRMITSNSRTARRSSGGGVARRQLMLGDIRGMIRKGQVKLAHDGQLKIGGKAVRRDGSRGTVPPVAKVKRDRRKANKQARASRRANR